MAYQSGKTYYLIPTCEVLSTNDVNNILNKKKQPHALNTKGTGGHYNNRNCNLWTLDYSTDMQWKVEIPAEGGYARILCAGDTSYGLDYYHGEDDNGNCDIYKVAGNENDSKVNFITVNATENLYKIQCYKDNTGNNLYLTAMGNSDSKEVTNGTDVRWQALDSSKTTFQIWWLVPVEDVKEGTTTDSTSWNLISPPTNINDVDIMATYNAPLPFTGSSFTLNNVPDKLFSRGIENNVQLHRGSGFKSDVRDFQASYQNIINAISDAVEVMYGHRNFNAKNICYFLFGEYDSSVGIHHGVDMAIGENSPIKALISGSVKYVNKNIGKVVIKNEDGQTCSCYHHMNDVTVSVGDNVVAGVSQIGIEGKKGYANGSHLHFEIRKESESGGAVPENYNFNTQMASIIPYGYMKKAVEIYKNKK